MLAHFGLGPREIVLLAALVAVPAVVALAVYAASRRFVRRPDDSRN